MYPVISPGVEPGLPIHTTTNANNKLVRRFRSPQVRVYEMIMERRLVAPTNTSPGYRLPSETRPGNERGVKYTFVRGEGKGEETA